VIRKSPYAGMLFNGLGRPLDLNHQSNTLPASMGGNKTPFFDEILLQNSNADDWLLHYHSILIKGEKNIKKIKMPDTFRRLTTVEAASIQTFPLKYKFCGEKSSIYRQIGNAVPCELAKAVANATISVKKYIFH
jgi:DNA (cytosine-5)-methyltransferase 1